MKLKSTLFGAFAVCASSACSAGDGASGVDKGLQCAAMISAADRLIAEQELPKDDLIREKGLIALMTYLAAYAIPKDLPEPQAFAELGTERDRLMSELDAGKILAKARTCVERARL